MSDTGCCDGCETLASDDGDVTVHVSIGENTGWLRVECDTCGSVIDSLTGRHERGGSMWWMFYGIATEHLRHHVDNR